jgi:hypothetical protein
MSEPKPINFPDESFEDIMKRMVRVPPPSKEDKKTFEQAEKDEKQSEKQRKRTK